MLRPRSPGPVQEAQPRAGAGVHICGWAASLCGLARQMVCECLSALWVLASQTHSSGRESGLGGVNTAAPWGEARVQACALWWRGPEAPGILQGPQLGPGLVTFGLEDWLGWE